LVIISTDGDKMNNPKYQENANNPKGAPLAQTEEVKMKEIKDKSKEVTYYQSWLWLLLLLLVLLDLLLLCCGISYGCGSLNALIYCEEYTTCVGSFSAVQE